MMAVASTSTSALGFRVGLPSHERRLQPQYRRRIPVAVAAIKATAQQHNSDHGRRAAMLGLGVALLSAVGASASKANPLIDELLEKSRANKELNDKKRLATSWANVARAYTVQFGICQVPYNFTGCHDLAKIKNVKFLTDDLKLECEGKDKFKCGSNVFWKW